MSYLALSPRRFHTRMNQENADLALERRIALYRIAARCAQALIVVETTARQADSYERPRRPRRVREGRDRRQQV
jgi:hypothetical protein